MIVDRRGGALVLQDELPFPEKDQAGIHHGRVVEDAPAAVDLFQRRFDAQGWPIGPVGGHRFDDIGDLEDPRLEQALLALQPLRIAGTVQPLMVLEDDPCHGPGKVDILQNGLSGPGVGLDQAVFDG